jgi:hypothetical protein
MAFVVEDGTGLETANAYVSVADADTYFTDSGMTTWTGVAALKEAAIVRGTAAIDGMYNSRWPGTRSSSAQALGWPRDDAWDMDGYALNEVPTAVINATCEAALIELVTPGALSVSLGHGGEVLREKVGPVEVEYKASAPGMTVYNSIRNALSRIVKIGGSMVFRRG